MDDIRLFSLLEPRGGCKYFELNDDTLNDLSVDFLVSNMTASAKEQAVLKKIFTNMPADREVIEYRQAVYRDLKGSPGLCRELYEIFDQMSFYAWEKARTIDNRSSIWELLTVLKRLENYTSSVIRINSLIEGQTFESDGMKRFSEYIHEIYNASGFDEFSRDMKNMAEDLSGIRSMTLGVNFDAGFYPSKVGIISMNDYYLGERSVIEQFISFHKKHGGDEKELDPFTMLTHPTKSIDDTSPLMNNLTSLVERMLPGVVSNMKRILKKYVDISGEALARLSDEFLFYKCAVGLEEKLAGAGLKCCCGEFSDADTYLGDLFNVKFAVYNSGISEKNEVICNDLSFTEKDGVLILTGPNRGGKTILTQAIGLAFLFFQQGIFVPCGSAKIKLCDGIYTHFPADENKTVTLGRLGEESERFCGICRTATPESLILFNESFSSTSHTESLYIAEDVIKYLCRLGARACFNTHMYELAEKAEEFGAAEKAVCGAVSIVMGQNNGERSYKITYGKPDGKSYAHDIAYQYGITFEQLCGNL